MPGACAALCVVEARLQAVGAAPQPEPPPRSGQHVWALSASRPLAGRAPSLVRESWARLEQGKQYPEQEKPERPDLARCWRQMEPARKLVAVGDRPILVLEAEASFYAGYNHCNVEYLEQAGVHTTFIRLADIGIHGNGHMMMMEKNSDQIAQVIVDWMEKTVAPLAARPPVAR